VPLNTLLGLLLINLIWSAHPIVEKLLLLEMTPFEAAWTRYFSALCAYLGVAAGFVLAGKVKKDQLTRSWNQFFVIPDKASDKLLVIAIGIMAFCLAPLFQMEGLRTSLAAENSIIVALEPIMTVGLAWLVLRESVSRLDFISFCFAFLGFGILAELHPLEVWRSAVLGDRLDSHLLGNLLLVVSLAGEASFSVLGKKLIRNYSPVRIFGSALGVGVLCLTILLVGTALGNGTFSRLAFFHLNHWGWKTFLAIFWIGPLGTTLGYLIYIMALVDASVIAVTLFLFLQPLAGALLSYLFLGERLNGLQCFGSVLILLAVLLPNALRMKNRT
jgi:drug/metabolite transporter (DMT)-like permease